MSIENLFCPPDGAVQFQLQQDYDGIPINRDDITFWVVPDGNCDAGARRFAILRDSVPDALILQSGNLVCECVGRVIE